MQYVVLLASKRDTDNRYWRTFKTLKEAKEYVVSWSENEWLCFIHKCEGNY